MKIIFKAITKFGFTILFTLLTITANSQKRNDKKVEKEIEKAVDNTIDVVEDVIDIFGKPNNKKKPNSNNSRTTTKANDDEPTNKKKKSSNHTIAQNVVNSSTPKGYSRYSIADNLVIDIKGIYPQGQNAEWSYIHSHMNNNHAYGKMITVSSDKYKLDRYRNENLVTSNVYAFIFLTSHDNKAVFVCNDTYADIDIPNGTVALTSTPQTFNLTNFRIRNGAQFMETPIEEARSAFINGGAKGEITLSCNSAGDVNMSFEIQYYHKASRNQGYGESNKLYIDNYSMPNFNTTEKANTYANNVRKNRIEDSLNKIERKKKEIEEQRLFEIKIKNSLANVIKLHQTYYFNFSSLKVDEYEKEESYTTYETRTKVVAAPYDPKTGRYTDIESERVPVYNYHMVRYSGYRNKSNRTIHIKGIRKLESKAGTIYYEDASIILKPNEISYDLVDIEENYYPSKAEIGSTHYYKGNIIK